MLRSILELALSFQPTNDPKWQAQGKTLVKKANCSNYKRDRGDQLSEAQNKIQNATTNDTLALEHNHLIDIARLTFDRHVLRFAYL